MTGQFLPMIAKWRPENYRSWIYGAGFIISLACLFFFCLRVTTLREGLQVLPPGAVTRIPLAALAYLLAYCLGAWAWGYLLRLLGTSTRLRLAVGICLTAQFGKYLPGNFAHHVGRVMIAKHHGISLPTAMASMIVETAIALVVMLLVSLPALVNFVRPGPIWLLAASVATLLVGALIWSRRQELRTTRETVAKRFSNASKLAWLIPIAIMGLCPLLSGCALLLLDAGFTLRFQTSTYVVSVFCVAWVTGFVTPGAPAGLGVRELILSEGLAPIVGTERAMAAAILLRLVSTIADLIAFGIGLILLHRRRSVQTMVTPPVQRAP